MRHGLRIAVAEPISLVANIAVRPSAVIRTRPVSDNLPPMTSAFQVRISTVFLAIALVELPISAGWLPIELPALGSRSLLLTWLLYDFVPSFFIVAFVAAMVGLVIAIGRRQPVMQFCTEMLMCFAALVLLPAY